MLLFISATHKRGSWDSVKSSAKGDNEHQMQMNEYTTLTGLILFDTITAYIVILNSAKI